MRFLDASDQSDWQSFIRRPVQFDTATLNAEEPKIFGCEVDFTCFSRICEIVQGMFSTTFVKKKRMRFEMGELLNFQQCIKSVYFVYDYHILCWISNVPFQNQHNIAYPYIERCVTLLRRPHLKASGSRKRFLWT